MTPRPADVFCRSRARHSLVVDAHAKVNLRLRVLSRRVDGYHDLETVFQALALHDTLRVSAGPRCLSLRCPDPAVPTDERNLVWRAARLIWQAGGRAGEPTGRARLLKRIPMQAGLGGGSADGAAALVAWDGLWGTALGRARLFELAAQLGADVPFFLCGGTAVGLSRGDDVLPLVDLPPRWVALAIPPFGVSTPEAFAWWDEDRAASVDAGVVARGARADVRWRGQRGGLLGSLPVGNDLEDPVARRHPEIGLARRLLTEAGAEVSAMTGSGSAVFGLYTRELLARAAATALRRQGWRVVVTRTATRRESAPVAS